MSDISSHVLIFEGSRFPKNDNGGQALTQDWHVAALEESPLVLSVRMFRFVSEPPCLPRELIEEVQQHLQAITNERIELPPAGFLDEALRTGSTNLRELGPNQYCFDELNYMIQQTRGRTRVRVMDTDGWVRIGPLLRRIA